jgi:hypothetical protein
LRAASVSRFTQASSPRCLTRIVGREWAKVRGVRFGRPLKLSSHQRREAIERLEAGDAVMDVAPQLRGRPGHPVSDESGRERVASPLPCCRPLCHMLRDGTQPRLKRFPVSQPPEHKDERLPQTPPDALRDLSPLSLGAIARVAHRSALSTPTACQFTIVITHAGESVIIRETFARTL